MVLAGILVFATAVRLVAWQGELTVPWAFPEMTAVVVDHRAEQGRGWSEWLASWRDFQVGSTDRSPLVLPVFAAFYWLLGSRFHLSALVGAVFGSGAVLLAWALGSRAVSPLFGLCFAALVAGSPLQILWSRLGGIHAVSVAHVLLVLWLSYTAGRRRSWPLTVLAGLAIFGSLYHYYAARVAMPLGFVALSAGLAHAGASLRRHALHWAVAILVVAAAWRVSGQPLDAAWPVYSGYFGKSGGQSILEGLAARLPEFQHQGRLAFYRYFIATRASWDGPGWGMRLGGLCLAPVAALALLGVGRILMRFRRDGWWLLVPAAGFALPIVSATTARRLLIADLGCLALAAHGLVALAAFLRRRLPPGAVQAVVLGLPTVLGAWSVGVLLLLHASVGPAARQSIPFGESGFGDGLTCLRCLAFGREVQSEVAGGGTVVLVDADVERENNTSPAGMALYGRLGAIAAGRRSGFVDFYAWATGLDPHNPLAGNLPQTAPTFAEGIIDALEHAPPTAVVWHFERPTAWERWFAQQLAAGGGRLETFDTPLSSTPGLRVRTPWQARAGAFEALRGVATSWQHDSGCPRLRRVHRETAPALVLHMAPRVGGPPTWATASWASLMAGGPPVPADLPVGSHVVRTEPFTWEVLTRRANLVRVPVSGGPLGTVRLPSPFLGLDCARYVDGAWWVIDSTLGRLTGAPAVLTRESNWAGITRDKRGQVILAAATQEIVVFDPERGEIVRRFPAVVPPSLRAVSNECTPVVSGGGRIATVNTLRSTMTFYTDDGRLLGTRDLHDLIGIPQSANWITAAAADGPRLGVAHHDVIDTLEVVTDPACGGEVRASVPRP
jgi:hypothetical protein